MTEEELATIEARADAATPGPWAYTPWGEDQRCGDVYSYSRRVLTFGTADGTVDEDDANGKFVAHARADVPALLAEVRLLRRVVQDQQEESALYDAGVKAGAGEAAREAGELVRRLLLWQGPGVGGLVSLPNILAPKLYIESIKPEDLLATLREGLDAHEGDAK